MTQRRPHWGAFLDEATRVLILIVAEHRVVSVADGVLGLQLRVEVGLETRSSWLERVSPWFLGVTVKQASGARLWAVGPGRRTRARYRSRAASHR